MLLLVLLRSGVCGFELVVLRFTRLIWIGFDAVWFIACLAWLRCIMFCLPCWWLLLIALWCWCDVVLRFVFWGFF